MVANLIPKEDGFRCSNCMMRQTGIPTHCYFCGYEFSNWEDIAYKVIITEIEEERRKNESDIYGESRA